MSEFTGVVVGLDSKQVYKEWFADDGARKEFRCLIGVAIQPSDNAAFEQQFDTIMGELCERYLIDRARPVYCASEIGSLLQPRGMAYKSFCLNFARRVLSLPDVHASYFVTRLNPTYLEGGKVNIYGEYGSARQRVSVPRFIELLYPYYNVVCGWKHSVNRGLRGATLLLDGIAGVPPSGAWRQISSAHYPRVIFNGDRTIPVIATADILIRSLDFFLEQRGGITDETAVRQIVLHGGVIPPANKSFVYVGNPDLPAIVPLRDSTLMPAEFAAYVHHPTIYLSAGGVFGQAPIIEGSELTRKVYRKAAELGAGVKLYDPRIDRATIGGTSTEDLFVPFTSDARGQLEALRTGGRNLRELLLD